MLISFNRLVPACAVARRTVALVAGVAFAVGVAVPAVAGVVSAGGGGLGYVSVDVTSIKEARFKKVIKQQYDFSCGSAALATLLTHHYGYDVTEQDVFDSMILFGDESKIRRYGFSLLDMKDYLEREGFNSNGFKAPLDAFVQAKVPGVALINAGGYLHFVVVKGVTRTEVLIGDPAAGVKTYPRPEFEAMWNGVAFVIMNKTKMAEASFNSRSAWKVRHAAPFGTALNRQSLGSFNQLLPRPGDF
jgi:predicted double-glycine peptidase